jgi:penicillin-binding protein 2
MGKRLSVNGTRKLWKNRTKNRRITIRRENTIEKKRIAFLLFLLFVLFSVLLFRAWQLQVTDYEKNAERLDKMRLRRDLAPAVRGNIYDRNGVLLANTTLKRVVNLSETFRGVYGQERAVLIKNVALQCGVSEIEVRDALNSLDDLPIRADLPTVDADLSIKYLFDRNYYFNGSISHLIGYVNKESSGIAGIERTLNNWLAGESGQYRIEVDSRTRTLTQHWVQKPKPGKNVVLSVDYTFQKEIEAITSELNTPHTIIVSNPKTGEILAMVSAPFYESSRMVQPFSQTEWEQLQNNPGKIFVNRAIQTRYNPGSLIKPWVTLCSMNQSNAFFQDLIVDRAFCHGSFPVLTTYGDTVHYRDWVSTGHGEVNLFLALQKSCNTFFYNLGLELGIERMYDFANISRITALSGVELPNEVSGFFPSAEWKNNTLKEKWYLGDTLLTAIGQSYVQLTPIEMLKLFELIANEGSIYRSTLIKNSHNQETKILDYPQAYWVYFKEALSAVVSRPGGTAFSTFSVTPYAESLAGKTGTAETGIEGIYHSWFACFYPKENPEVSVIVIVEKGGYGSAVAAPIAKQVLDKYFEHAF